MRQRWQETTLFADANGNGVQDSGESTTASPAYDSDGNMTADGGAGGPGRKFVWDGENRLTEVWDSSTPSKKLAKYTYDYRNRRVMVETTADAPQGTTKIGYAYNGWNVIAEYNLLSAIPTVPVKRHDWGLDLSGSRQGAGGVGGLLRTTLDGTAHYVLCDGNGNVTDLRSTADGATTAHYEYDSYGNILLLTGSVATLNRYRFSTKPSDSESNLAYYGYRYYTCVFGRWATRDPIEEDGGSNLYCYVGNRPISVVDVLGLDELIIGMDQASSKSTSYKDMKEAAKYAGFTITEKCTLEAIAKAIANPENTKIFSYTHGVKNGTLQLDKYIPKLGWGQDFKKITDIVEPAKVAGREILVTSCAPSKVVTPFVSEYEKSKASLKSVTGPEHGDDLSTDRNDDLKEMTTYFTNIKK